MSRPSDTIVAEGPARFSVEEFLRFAEAFDAVPGKVELVDGVIVRTAPPNYPHFSVQRQIFRKLDAIFGEGIDGIIVGQDLSVRFGEATIRTPDVAIFRDPGAITGVADGDILLLAVDVSDISLRDDIGAKQLTYAAARVPEYWVVDIKARRVHRFVDPLDGDYGDETVTAFGERLAVPGSTTAITID